jgi:Protein of unknown function (DUF1566)
MYKSAMAGAAMLAFLAGTAHAIDPTVKCQQAKLKAQSKLKACLLKSAAGVLGGKDDVSAACRPKFQDTVDKVDAKAAAKSVPCRFMDNGDGTVSDLNTGLVWEQKDDLGGIHDKDDSYTWGSYSVDYTTPSGTVFTTFLYNLNGRTSSDGGDDVTGCFTGHCDWRLPSIQELQGILLAAYPCATDPCIDPAFGPTFSGFYWSGNTHSNDPGSAWAVRFTDGLLSAPIKGDSGFGRVRAVRGGL